MVVAIALASPSLDDARDGPEFVEGPKLGGLDRGRAEPASLQLGGRGQSASGKLPRTAWGDPDLQGVWNYATMTPLERPRELADKAILTEEEAAAYEKQVLDRQAVTNNTAGPDWWDPGTRRLMERRTSLIVDPPDGRLPPQTKETQARAAARTPASTSRSRSRAAQRGHRARDGRNSELGIQN